MYFSSQPVERAYVFGSYARGDNHPKSDIDILVTFDKEARISLFDHVRMMYELQDLLGINVDLITEGSLLPFAARTSEKDKILVYERAS
ncbi:MAG: nucleotidyltransferase family protein [Bacteroidales bacterium]|nr:nucleotidyltransferase family protein [Bacteroidales bacterium]